MSLDSPLEFFKIELTAENTADKVRTLHRTRCIASIIGPEDTRAKLLPCLLEFLQCGDDEILLGLAEELALLVDYIGPLQDYLPLLVPPLETLASQEETVVREQAVISFSILLSKAAEAKTAERLSEEYIINVVERLSGGEWFAPRVSACGLIPIVYPYAKEDDRNSLRKIFATLMADDTPMVHRVAASKLKDFAAVAEKLVIEKTLYPLVVTTWKNESQDAVRVSALSAAIVIAEHFNASENQTKIFTIIQAAATDRSWRIRLNLAESFDKLIDPFKPDISSLLASFKLLLEDSEQDIRIASLTTLERVVSKVSNHDITNSGFTSSFQLLSEDPVPAVRSAVASVIGPLAVACGKQTAETTLLPVILEMMRDEFHDVRLNIVCHAGELCQLLGLPSVEHQLVAAVESLMQDLQWRVRLEVVNQLPKLAKQFGPTAFQTNLEPLFFNAFTDSVYAVRQCAIENVQRLGETFGPQWISCDLLPRLLDKFYGRQHATPSPTAGRIPGFGGSTSSLIDDQRDQGVSYLTRLTVLHCVPVVVKVLPPASIETDIVPLLVAAIKDPVSNVRFAAARIIKTLTVEKTVPSSLLTKFLEPALSRLKEEDQDVDVQYFTDEALQAVSAA